MEKFICQTQSENSKVVELILKKLTEKKSNILFLVGNLGAGKTTLTYDLAKYLNTQNQVSSPTFVIQKIYSLSENQYNFIKIYHLDLYRLTDRREIDDLDLFEETENMSNLFIIEWPEKVLDLFTNFVTVKIESGVGDSRIFEIN